MIRRLPTRGFALAVLLLVTASSSCTRAAEGTAASANPTPTATTIGLPESECQSIKIGARRFEDVAVARSETPPPFTGSHFVGLARIAAMAKDTSTVSLDLADPVFFRVYGRTRVAITNDTDFDYREKVYAVVGQPGAPAGSSVLPLAPGAPAVDAGAYLQVECMISNHSNEEVIRSASAAATGAASWALARPLSRSWPAGAQVSFDRTVHVPEVADLHLAVGQSLQVEITAQQDGYRAIRLTNVMLDNTVPAQ